MIMIITITITITIITICDQRSPLRECLRLSRDAKHFPDRGSGSWGPWHGGCFEVGSSLDTSLRESQTVLSEAIASEFS